MQQGKSYLHTPAMSKKLVNSLKNQDNTVPLCGMRFAIRRHHIAQKKIATNLRKYVGRVCESARTAQTYECDVNQPALCVSTWIHSPLCASPAKNIVRSRPEAYVQQQQQAGISVVNR